MGKTKIDLRPQIDAMIAAGYHLLTSQNHGMGEAEYRLLWGREVIVPEAFVGRFDQAVLLVDRTISVERLWGYPSYDMQFAIRPGHCRTVVPLPQGTQDVLTRYIAFIRFHNCGRRHAPSEFLTWKEVDEIGLNVCEGLHLPVQFTDRLKHSRKVVLTGSVYGIRHVPIIDWTFETPCLEEVFCERASRSIFVSRGVEVIHVE